MAECLKTTLAPLNWPPVSRIPRCTCEHVISTPSSIIIFATKFKMEPFPFIQFPQLKCLLSNILTKICNEETHTMLREQLMGWSLFGAKLHQASEGVKENRYYWSLVHCTTVPWSYSSSPIARLLRFLRSECKFSGVLILPKR